MPPKKFHKDTIITEFECDSPLNLSGCSSGGGTKLGQETEAQVALRWVHRGVNVSELDTNQEKVLVWMGE